MCLGCGLFVLEQVLVQLGKHWSAVHLITEGCIKWSCKTQSSARDCEGMHTIYSRELMMYHMVTQQVNTSP